MQLRMDVLWRCVNRVGYEGSGEGPIRGVRFGEFVCGGSRGAGVTWKVIRIRDEILVAEIEPKKRRSSGGIGRFSGIGELMRLAG